MSTLATTKMSSKGQVVIPEKIRTKLGLKPGTQFIAVGEGDVVIFKKIAPPSFEDFDALIAEARKRARQAGLRRSDIPAAVRDVRRAR
ncbi:MAG: AbrB/MazE/SpoVT family DNA-binding domain-containing protein [Deltaproteobacteria bacterium]|nr:AbrB/MazE/SpoVT family DNA-binding domain-containing protein [Deltaproteobacteria bacterium]